MPSAGVLGPHIRACRGIAHIQITMSNMLVSLGKELVRRRYNKAKRGLWKWSQGWGDMDINGGTPKITVKSQFRGDRHGKRILTVHGRNYICWLLDFSFQNCGPMSHLTALFWGLVKAAPAEASGAKWEWPMKETESCVRQDRGVVPQGMGIFRWLFSHFKQRATKMDENNVC